MWFKRFKLILRSFGDVLELVGNVKEVPTINTNYEDQPLQEIDINADLLGVMLSENNSSATLKFQGRPESIQDGDKLRVQLSL